MPVQHCRLLPSHQQQLRSQSLESTRVVTSLARQTHLTRTPLQEGMLYHVEAAVVVGQDTQQTRVHQQATTGEHVR